MNAGRDLQTDQSAGPLQPQWAPPTPASDGSAIFEPSSSNSPYRRFAKKKQYTYVWTCVGRVQAMMLS